MEALANRILSGRRKRLIGSKPLFERYRAVSASDLRQLEDQLGIQLPEALRQWLLLVGYGDVSEDLSFRAEWFSVVENGALKSNVIFAQDILGNFYSFDPQDGKVFFFSRSTPEYAVVARDFRSFMEELERREFKIIDWMDKLPLLPYEWNA